VRGKGLLWAVEFVTNKKTKSPFPPDQRFAHRVGAAAMGRGLVTYPMQGCVDGMNGDHLALAPAAIISREEIGWAIDKLSAAIQEAEGSASRGLH
jgi:adenosylmethionine-8-amino-7-oxononanoate aminotransferase